jgi:hypothetical protein
VDAVPDSLLARLREAPLRAPETLALAAVERHAPAAAAWAEEQAPLTGAPVAQEAVRRHVRLARAGGAATGAAGFVGVLPDLVGSAWLQSRMVLRIPAAFGFDPRHRMRPAELLVLWELYDDVDAARRALDGDGTSMAVAAVGRRLSRGGRDEQLVAVLARTVGRRLANRLGGRVVPGLGALVASSQNATEMRELGERALAFYGGA